MVYPVQSLWASDYRRQRFGSAPALMDSTCRATARPCWRIRGVVCRRTEPLPRRRRSWDRGRIPGGCPGPRSCIGQPAAQVEATGWSAPTSNIFQDRRPRPFGQDLLADAEVRTMKCSVSFSTSRRGRSSKGSCWPPSETRLISADSSRSGSWPAAAQACRPPASVDCAAKIVRAVHCRHGQGRRTCSTMAQSISLPPRCRSAAMVDVPVFCRPSG